MMSVMVITRVVKTAAVLGIGLILSLSIPMLAGVEWQTNGAPVCTTTGVQESPGVVALASGGAIVVWADRRGIDYDIYAQRLDSNGHEVWAAGGVKISGANYDQLFPAAVTDGAGGVIVVWQDSRLGDDGLDIYAQRIRPDGTIAWQVDGMPVCTHLAGLTDPPAAFSHVVISDGSGGAIIAWRDTRTDPVAGNTEIYAQRLNSNGTPQWTLNGVKLLGFNTTKWATRNPIIASDGAGGAVVVWQDARNTTATANDLYAQRVSSAGTAQWPINGVVVCNAAGDQGYPDIVALSDGKVAVVWEDKRSGSYDVYTQLLDGSGAALWGSNGRLVCGAVNDQRTPRVVGNGGSGVVVAWTDKRDSTVYTDIYAQRLDDSGLPKWTGNGNAVCTAAGSQTRIRMCESSAGSTILTFMDTRNETVSALYDLYAQMIDAQGSVVWAAEGLPVAVLPGTTQRLQQAVMDGAGGVYAVWEDDRNSGDWDIYTQRLSSVIAVNSIGIVKGLPDGIQVSLPARVVTGAFNGFFYIEETDQYSGVKVVSTQSVSVGDLVLVTGQTATDTERYISASSVIPMASTPNP